MAAFCHEGMGGFRINPGINFIQFYPVRKKGMARQYSGF
jgi:hypothetical protein